jgi:sialate O-acetylesterase
VNHLYRVSIKFFTLLLMCVAPSCWAALQPAGLFTDHMMLQRDTKAAVWGTSEPDETITLTLATGSDGSQAVATTSAHSSADGKWLATFQDLKAGGPYILRIEDSREHIVLNDVLVGDIWICSGQSNMEYKLQEASEIAAPADPMFRYLLIPKNASIDPLHDIKPGAQWVSASPETRSTFTAVGYYFGRKLRHETGVPIGLIHTSWGGTPAEVWMSKETLDAIPQFGTKADSLIQSVRDLDSDAAKFAIAFPAWEKQYGAIDPSNKDFANGWAAPELDTTGWTTVNYAGDWSNLPVPHGGVIWIRKHFPVSANLAGKDFRINLDAIPDFDTTYFNGVEIGHGGNVPPYFWGSGRMYVIPGKLVHEGDNLLAIRVVSQQQKNHLFGNNNRFNSQIVPSTLPDGWLAKVEVAFPAANPTAVAAEPTPPTAKRDGTPTVLFNAMVLPLIPYGIKGVIWYQGENNASRGYNYRTIFADLIQSWRTQWGLGDFPFYFVQLANFKHAPTGPNDPPDWAEVRESQMVVSQAVPHTGMATTIDIGDPRNIHPADKLDVGERLALIALAKDYGKPVEFSGPIFDSMQVVGSTVHLRFTHAASGLIAKADGPLKMFAIAGADQHFAWADATIQGNEVIVSSKDVLAPVAVRYAYFSNPEGSNLYNANGLPAPPFRTDAWPTPTADVWW